MFIFLAVRICFVEETILVPFFVVSVPQALGLVDGPLAASGPNEPGSGSSSRRVESGVAAALEALTAGGQKQHGEATTTPVAPS